MYCLNREWITLNIVCIFIVFVVKDCLMDRKSIRRSKYLRGLCWSGDYFQILQIILLTSFYDVVITPLNASIMIITCQLWKLLIFVWNLLLNFMMRYLVCQFVILGQALFDHTHDPETFRLHCLIQFENESLTELQAYKSCQEFSNKKNKLYQEGSLTYMSLHAPWVTSQSYSSNS